jgi:hypothetical protein
VCDWTAPEDSGLPASARHESAGVDETVSGMIPDANYMHTCCKVVYSTHSLLEKN